MTVTSDINAVERAGNGVATSFSFSPVRIFDETQLEVVVRDADGVLTTVPRGTGSSSYAVVATFAENESTTGSIRYPEAGGSPLPSGSFISIRRIIPATQEVSFENQGGYLPEVQEALHDQHVMRFQQIQEELDRSVKVAFGSDVDVEDYLTLVTEAATSAAASAAAAEAAAEASVEVPSSTPILATGSSVPITLADEFAFEVNPLRYGLVADGVTNNYAPWNAMMAAIAAGSVVKPPKGTYIFDDPQGCLINKKIVLDMSSGAIFKFLDNSGRYLRITASGTRVTMPTIHGNTPTVRTNYPGIWVLGGCSDVEIDRPNIVDVAGAGYIVENATDVRILSPYIYKTKADGGHFANGSGPCLRCSVSNGIAIETGDDSFSIVSYDQGQAVNRDISITGCISYLSETAGFTVAGVIGARVDGQVRGAKGPYAFRMEQDTSYLTFTSEHVQSSVSVYGVEQAGALVGKGVLDCDVQFNIHTTGTAATSIRQGVFIGSNASSNRTTRCRVRVKSYGAGSAGVEINGTSGCTVEPDVHNSNTHGVVALANNSGLHLPGITAFNNSQASAGTSNNIFLVTGPDTVTVGSVLSVDNQGSPTISECMRVTGSSNVTIGAYTGIKNGSAQRIAFDSGGGANTNVRFLAPTILTASISYDAPSLVDGATTLTPAVITVTGAAFGDKAEASMDLDTSGVIFQAWVSAADTVSVRLCNETGGTVNLPSGILRAWVTKRP